MPNPLNGKHIILGVTGSIACYKAADLASKLAQSGAQVDVLLTAAALQFVTPLTFQSVTGRRAYVDADLWGSEAHVIHVGLGHMTDLVLIAPTTANTIAKLAQGLADNLLTVTALAARCPLVIAPAMDAGMFEHPATQANVEILRQRGATLLGPAEGHLASGLTGRGRMLEPAEILAEVRRLFARTGPLAGRRVVVTAGGTQEPIDPVRRITNRSSGKQGFAIAQAALDRGAQVTLIAGPVALPAPAGAQRVDVETAQEMLAAVLAASREADALIMAAAPADFRPATTADQKIKKEAGLPEIRLVHTQDILAEVARQKAEISKPSVTAGFAAESRDLLDNARRKLQAKQLDFIVANDISASDAGFSVDDNRVTLLYDSGEVEPFPLMSKAEVAEVVLDRVETCLGRQVVHILPASEWEAVQASGASEYRSPSLDQVGFIHFSRPEQVPDVANHFFSGRMDLVLLVVEPRLLKAPLRFDPVGAEFFPHLYGPLNLDAVIEVKPFKR